MGGGTLLKLQPWACSPATSPQHLSPATKGHIDPFRGIRFGGLVFSRHESWVGLWAWR